MNELNFRSFEEKRRGADSSEMPGQSVDEKPRYLLFIANKATRPTSVENSWTAVGKGPAARSLRNGVLYWTVKEMVRLVPAVPVADLFVYGVPVRVCPPVDSVPAL